MSIADFCKSRLNGVLIGRLVILVLLLTFANMGRWAASGQTNSAIHFGDHGNAQFVDPDGANQVYYAYNSTSSQGEIKFELFTIDEPTFALLYGSLSPGSVPDVTGYEVASSWTEFASEVDRFSFRATTLPDVAGGIYLLVGTDEKTGAQGATLVTISRAALILKADTNGRFTAWASTLHDGQAIADMIVTVYDTDGNALANATTNADGVAVIETNSAFDIRYNNADTLVAIGSSANHVTVSGTDLLWRNSRYDGYFRDPGANYAANLYTERPLYKPGDTIFFKAIVRVSDDGQYSIPAGEAIQIQLKDSRGDSVDSVELTLDEFGTASGEFTLSEGVPLGTYLLLAQIGPQDFTQSFTQDLKVEEYQKPEYGVEVSGSEPFGITGQSMEIIVDANYFFGQPTANADVSVVITKNSYRWFTPWWGWRDYDYIVPSSNEIVAEFSGKTDANGRFVNTFTPAGDIEYTTWYKVKATVTDDQGRPIDGSLSVPVYPTAYELVIETEKYGYQKGETVTVNATLSRHDGSPVAGETVTVSANPNSYGYETVTPPPVVQTVTTDADGNAQALFDGLVPGWYQIKATAVDESGRTIERYNYVWVYHQDAAKWWYFGTEELTVTVDKDRYQVGDTAQLLIQSHVENTMALVTLEREQVLAEIVVKIDGPVTNVEVPVSEELSPNAVVKVHLYKPVAAHNQLDYYYSAPVAAELLIARTELSVDTVHKQLDIAVQADQEEYLPGDQATVTLKVTDHEGNPVRAQLSLALIDKALLSIAPDTSQALDASFYGRRASQIATFQSPIRPYFYRFGPIAAEPTLEFDDAAPPEETALDGDANTPESGRGSDSQEIPLRDEFLDTAYWNPRIVTDDNGTATVVIELPDNLTTWLVVVKAVTVETQVGQTVKEMLVSQDRIVQEIIPRFAILGDTMRIGAVGRNFTGQDLIGQANVSCSNLLLLDDGTRSLELPDNGSDVAYWTAVASKIGDGTVTANLLAGDGGDRIELPLEVKPFAIPERDAFSAMVSAENSPFVYPFEVPLNAINQESSLSLNLSPSLALSLLEDLQTLIDYPYGCVEQIMSRLMPSAAASIVYKELGIPNPKASELPDIMHKGVQLLKDLQKLDGGWTWYGLGEINQHITAYVLLGLTLVQEAGFPVPSEMLDDGFGYLDSVLPGVQDDNVRAYIIYVQSRAGRGNLANAQSLVELANDLDSFSLGVLAQTLHKEGDQQSANDVLDILLTRVKDLGSEAYVEAGFSYEDWYHWKTMASDEKSTAAALSALAKIRPQHALLHKLARWLLSQRRGSSYYSGAGWKDTHATASAVIGLLDYIKVSRELEANYSYSISLNGTEISSGQVTPENFTEPIDPILISGELMRFGDNELRITRTDGNGALYATGSLRMQLYYAGFEQAVEFEQGIRVSRTYRYADSGKEVGNEPIAVGTLIRAEIAVENQSNMSYFMLTSPNPAGFEVVDDGVATSPYGSPWGDEYFVYPQSYGYKDIRLDRVDFFTEQLHQGQHLYTYELRALFPGKFSIMAAEGGPMYNPEFWGRSSTAQLAVSPELLAARPTLSGDLDNDCYISQFDAQQVAAAWGTGHPLANVHTGDALVDLQDVASVAGRVGANCLTDIPAPAPINRKGVLSMVGNQGEAAVAQTFTVDIVLNQGFDVGGFGINLNYDPTRVRFEDVAWHGVMADALPLGPNVDNQTGATTLGAYNADASLAEGTHVATITFRALAEGAANIEISQAQLSTGRAQIIETEIVNGENQMIFEGGRTFLPLVQ